MYLAHSQSLAEDNEAGAGASGAHAAGEPKAKVGGNLICCSGKDQSGAVLNSHMNSSPNGCAKSQGKSWECTSTNTQKNCTQNNSYHCA